MLKIDQWKINFIQINYHKTIKDLVYLLDIGTGTASKYLSDARNKYETTEQRNKRIKAYTQKGAKERFKSLQNTKNEVLNSASMHYETFKNDVDFMIGLGLYWGEGHKRTFGFTNSDTAMLDFMAKWLHKYFDTFKVKLYVKYNVGQEKMVEKFVNRLDKSLYDDIAVAIVTNPMRKPIAQMSISSDDLFNRAYFMKVYHEFINDMS